MGTKSKPQQMPFETNYQHTFMAPPETAASNAVRDFKFDGTVQDAATNSVFGQNARRIEEGAGGYQRTGNSILDSRIKQLGLLDNAKAYSNAVGDANMQRQGMRYGQTLDYARLMNPQLQTTRQSGFQTAQRQGGNFWGDLLRAGAQVGSSAIMMCDERLKENMTPISGAQALQAVAQNPVIGFNYKGESESVLGWSAQRTQQVLPIAVREIGDEKHLGLDLMTMLATAWASIQELSRITSAQAAELVALREELTTRKGIANA